MPDFTCLTTSRAPEGCAFCPSSPVCLFLRAGLRGFGSLVDSDFALLDTADLLSLAGPIADLRLLHTSFTSDLSHGRQLAQAVDGRPDHVVRVGRPQRLRENVGHPG